jgi:hypothetical protein
LTFDTPDSPERLGDESEFDKDEYEHDEEDGFDGGDKEADEEAANKFIIIVGLIENDLSIDEC